jgi:hypothetical protein
MTVICPYCSIAAILTDSAEVYHGHSYGMIWLCRPCQAWVGVHKNTQDHKPLGRLANKELREWKQKAHAVFDPLWQEKLRRRIAERGPEYRKHYARGSAYRWLAEQLEIPFEDCHIGMFDVDTCKRVVALCKPYAEKLRRAA